MCLACSSSVTPSRRERDRALRALPPGDRPEAADRGKRDRKLRADVFDVPANAAKAQAVAALWAKWRRGLLAEGNVARADIMAGRDLRARMKASEEALHPAIAASKARIGAQEQQMIRAQMAGTVASWLSNRQNGVREAITDTYTPRRWGGRARRRFEDLPEERRRAVESDLAILRHELHAINSQKLWMAEPGPAVMRRLDDGRLVPVSERARRLARTMFQGLAFRHRWPRFRHLSMRLDERVGVSLEGKTTWIAPAEAGGLFSWWLHFRPTGSEAPVLLPVRGWGRDRREARGVGLLRPGVLGRTANLFLGEGGQLKVALTRDLTEVFARSRAAYEPLTEVLALDFGLTHLFATNHGDLLGRGFLAKIRPLAERIMAEARRMQKRGKKPRDSALHGQLVTRLRGLIETEINRAMNHAVALWRPKVLVVEKLDFRGSGLSRRLNRLLANCGRGAVQRKLADLEDRHGIEIHEVVPAYTSQTCSGCGYVDRRNRKGETFCCRHCGRKLHADVNGARNIAASVTGAGSGPGTGTEAAEADGRSVLPGAPSAGSRRTRKRRASSDPRVRALTLREIVRRFDERKTVLGPVSRPKRGDKGTRESAPDPRLTNPYWKRHQALGKEKLARDRNVAETAFAVDA